MEKVLSKFNYWIQNEPTIIKTKNKLNNDTNTIYAYSNTGCKGCTGCGNSSCY